MDVFDQEKNNVLSLLGKPDRSKKGSVDEAAWPLINTINDLEDFYTTSSCAGRISIFKEPSSGKKHEAEWLFVTHDQATEDDVISTLTTVPAQTIWFRMEPPIFHVACRDFESAQKLLRACQNNGWKRCGIISTGGKRLKQRRYMIEIVSNERVEAPIASKGKVLCDEEYLRFLVEKGNKKLEITRKKLEELRLVLKTLSCNNND